MVDTKMDHNSTPDNVKIELGCSQGCPDVAEAARAVAKIPVRLWTVVYSVLTTCLLTLLVGTTITFSSPALVELTQLQDQQFRFNTELSDVFGAVSLIGGIFGGPLGGWIADKFGRKTSLVLNSAPYISGYFIILASSSAMSGAVFKVLLMAGRFISGLGMGWAYVLVGMCGCASVVKKEWVA